MQPYAKVTQVWVGGSNSLLDPQDMPVITLSKKLLQQFGGADLEKLNIGIEYDVTDLNYAANISLAIIFDKTYIVYQTDLRSVQGQAKTYLRLPFLPKYDNQKKIGSHTLDVIVKLRPRWTIWHMVNSYQDFSNLSSVAESTSSHIVTLTE